MKQLLLLLLVGCALLTLTTGDTPFADVWNGALDRLLGTSSQWNPLLDERLPRLIVILCTGASLAVSGAVMQALFHNPLASPSVLGITSGASLLAVVVFIFNWHQAHPYAIPIASFAGCMATLLLVYSLSRRQFHSLVLTGIAIATLFLAIQEVIAYAFRDHWQLMQTLSEWKAGSTADRSWRHVHMQLPVTLVGLFGCWTYAKEIDILALGEEEAIALGVEVKKVRWRLFLSVSLLTGGALASVGNIAFFGLVLPHIIRSFVGPKGGPLIRYGILGGGVALIAMDLIIRSLKIHAFTVGNISAVLGGCFFLILLVQSRRHFTLFARA